MHRCVRHASWLRAEQGNARAGDETTCPALIYGTTSSTATSPGVDPASRRANDGRLPSGAVGRPMAAFDGSELELPTRRRCSTCDRQCRLCKRDPAFAAASSAHTAATNGYSCEVALFPAPPRPTLRPSSTSLSGTRPCRRRQTSADRSRSSRYRNLRRGARTAPRCRVRRQSKVSASPPGRR